MYLLYYVAIGTVKKRERRKRSDNNVLVTLCSHGYCKERKKRGKKVTGTVVWVGGYNLVDVTIVYGSNSFFVCVY